MREVYSRLWHLLDEQGWSIGELTLALEHAGFILDQRVLQKFADPDHPIKRLNFQAAEAICRILGVPLGALLVFAPSLVARFGALPRKKQRRLAALSTRHEDNALDEQELAELATLVQEVEAIGLANTRLVVEHRDYLRRLGTAQHHTAAD